MRRWSRPWSSSQTLLLLSEKQFGPGPISPGLSFAHQSYPEKLIQHTLESTRSTVAAASACVVTLEGKAGGPMTQGSAQFVPTSKAVILVADAAASPAVMSAVQLPSGGRKVSCGSQ